MIGELCESFVISLLRLALEALRILIQAMVVRLALDDCEGVLRTKGRKVFVWWEQAWEISDCGVITPMRS